MGVTDLGAGGAIGFAGRFRLAFHQAGIRGKLLHPVKAMDIADFIKDGERQNLSDARNRTQDDIRLIVVLPGMLVDATVILVIFRIESH